MQQIELVATSKGAADQAVQGAAVDVESAGGAAAPQPVDHLVVDRNGTWRGRSVHGVLSWRSCARSRQCADRQACCRPLHLARFYGEALELFWCVVRQFNVISVVHKEEFSLMRASFYFTHHIDTGWGAST